MCKKYIFMDLDGTIIDHSTNTIPDSTIEAIRLLQQNGHEVIISTGRPPALFYDIDKLLKIDSYIALNGRIVVYKGELILNQYIDKEILIDLVNMAEKNKIEIAFESITDYVLNKKHSDLSCKFSDIYHIEHPKVYTDYHLDHDVHQLVLFYTKDDYLKFEKIFPMLNFHISNKYGIDVNAKGGMKEIGIKTIIEKYGLDVSNTIAVGDGDNDKTMIEYAHLGIAMGNAGEPLKQVADMVADSVDNDGIYKLFKKLNMI